MAIITMPAGARIRRVEWTLDQPAQVNRSDWTKRRQVVTQPGPAIWSATAEFVTALGADAVLDAQAFLVELEGQVNSFRLIAVEQAQAADALIPVVDGAGQSGRALELRGGIAGAALKRGHKLTVNDQMVMLMSPATFDGAGKASVIFKPSLRYSPVDGAATEVRRPTVLVALTTSAIGWSVDPGRQYQAKPITVEEVV